MQVGPRREAIPQPPDQFPSQTRKSDHRSSREVVPVQQDHRRSAGDCLAHESAPDELLDDGAGIAGGDAGSSGELPPRYGLLEAGQTISFDDELPSFTLEDQQIVDGRLIARPFEVSLPITVFDTSLELQLTQGAIELDFHDDGTVTGVIAGGTPTAYIINVVNTEAVDAGLTDIMESLLGLYADLSPNDAGECEDISVNFEYEAIPAYFFDE